MYAKILLIALSAAAFSSCSTAYKSGQTPDDVYYSPVRYVDEQQNNNNRDEAKKEDNEDKSIRMRVRDHRWREFDDDYRYDNSPYHYCTCKCSNTGYYYNPYYHPWPVYTTKIIPVNTTPRTVNLNSYTGYNNNTTVNPKTGNGINWVAPPAQYNNTNRSGLGNTVRQIFSPSNSSSRSSNNSRTYSPSSNSSNSSNSSSNSNSGSSSSSSSSSGKVTRPSRGG